MAVMPERPARIFSQAPESPVPTGETMPIPVTTTRRLGMARMVDDETVRDKARANRPGKPQARPDGLLLQMRVDVIDGLLHGRDLLCLFIGNLGFEFFFQRHHQL